MPKVQTDNRVVVTSAAKRLLAFECLYQHKTEKEVVSEFIMNNCSPLAYKAAGVEEGWVEPAIERQISEVSTNNQTEDISALPDGELLTMVDNNAPIIYDNASKELIRRWLNEQISGTQMGVRLHRSKSSVNEYIKRYLR